MTDRQENDQNDHECFIELGPDEHWGCGYDDPRSDAQVFSDWVLESPVHYLILRGLARNAFLDIKAGRDPQVVEKYTVERLAAAFGLRDIAGTGKKVPLTRACKSVEGIRDMYHKELEALTAEDEIWQHYEADLLKSSDETL